MSMENSDVKGNSAMVRLGLMVCFSSILGLMGCMVSVQGQTVSSITFDGIGDSSTRVIFNVSSPFNGLRVRYGTASCAGGSGGSIQTNGTNMAFVQLYGMTAQLSGLAPGTTYHVCPEVSNNGGAWSSGADATFTTLARTQILPTKPAAVSTSFPEQTGATRGVAADCSDLQAKINAAVPGDTIVIPAGAVCTGNYTTPLAPDAKAFRPANVVTSKSVITIPGHGFMEGQEVHFSGSNGACLPGNGIYGASTRFYFYNCEKAGGWNKNSKYYVHVADSSHIQILNAPGGSPVVPGWINFSTDTTAGTITFFPTWATPGGYTTSTGFTPNTRVQFVSSGSLPGGLTPDTTYFLLSACSPSANTPCSSRVSLTPGGPAVNITSAGTGVHTIVDCGSGTMYIAPAPTQAGPWIVLKTSGTLPPAGARIDPSSDTQLFQLKKNTPLDQTPVFVPGILAHNWRIEGALFNTGTNVDYLTSTDPRPYCAGPSTNQDNRYIVFDRIRVQGPGYPNRLGCRNNAGNMFWDGGYISVINSDLRGLDFWHPWYGAATGVNGGGLVPTVVNSSQVNVTPGVGHGGVFTTTLTATTTIEFTGGFASGTAYVYFAMDGSLKVLAPAGITGNCSTQGATCTFLTAANPDWPVDGNKRKAALALFIINLTAGSVSGVASANPTTAYDPPMAFEGTAAIVAGNGPGPYLLSNNYFSGAGLTVHFDDSGGTLLDRGDYTITNNTFDIPAARQLLGPSSDGLWYGHRQPLEWKAGQRILVSGNVFQGCFSQVNNLGVCVAITPRSGGYVTDVDVSNNQFLNVVGAATLASPIDTYAPLSKPAARQRFSNNLALINAWSHNVPTESTPYGWFLYASNAIEDVTISHNTIYDNRGQLNTFLWLVLHPMGGVSITDNIYFYTGDRGMLGSENVAGCSGASTDKAMMDCAFTSGPANPSYKFAGNLIIPSWGNSSAASGFVDSSKIKTAFGSLASTNSIPVGTSQAAVLALVNFASDYTLSPSSPYYTSCSAKTACGYTATKPVVATPKINEVVNTASLKAGPVAPGEFVTIFGSDLGSTSPLTADLVENTTAPSLLGDASVSFNGFPAPLLYVRNDQINLVAPYEIAGATDLSVVVTLDGLASAPFPLTPAEANPAVFTRDGSGTGQGAIMNLDHSINSPSNAAARGGQIIVYITGEGQTDPPGLTGKITAAPTPQPVLPVAAFINGSQVSTVYYGEAIGMAAGMMQLNLRIPDSIPSGELPLIVSVGDKLSQPGVTVSIQ